MDAGALWLRSADRQSSREVERGRVSRDRHVVLPDQTAGEKRLEAGPIVWNTMDITLDGNHTIVMLNGKKVTDFKEGDPVPEKKFDFEPQRGPRPEFGWFGLQNHSDNDIVFFKEVVIKPLKKYAREPATRRVAKDRDL